MSPARQERPSRVNLSDVIRLDMTRDLLMAHRNSQVTRD
jgi:hypothetical protein